MQDEFKFELARIKEELTYRYKEEAKRAERLAEFSKMRKEGTFIFAEAKRRVCCLQVTYVRRKCEEETTAMQLTLSIRGGEHRRAYTERMVVKK